MDESALSEHYDGNLLPDAQTWPRLPLHWWGIPPTRESPLSNAGAHLVPEADATQERTLEAVSSSGVLGQAPWFQPGFCQHQMLLLHRLSSQYHPIVFKAKRI
jgi:hypothetical protein